jgi:hypothetical protein
MKLIQRVKELAKKFSTSDDIQAQTWMIGPREAAELLFLNTDNRAPRKNVIARLARDIEAGYWSYTHQGIAFDKNGILIDGQHRLKAIENLAGRLDIPHAVLVFFNVDRHAFSALDTGTKKTAVDLFPEISQPRAVRLANIALKIAEGKNSSSYYDVAPLAEIFEARLASHEIFRIAPKQGLLHSILAQVMFLQDCEGRVDIEDVYTSFFELYRESRAKPPAPPAVIERLRAGLPPLVRSYFDNLGEKSNGWELFIRACKAFDPQYIFSKSQVQYRAHDQQKAYYVEKVRQLVASIREDLAESVGENMSELDPQSIHANNEIHVSTVRITKDLAAKWLGDAKTSSRDERYAQQLASMIESGIWEYTHQGIALDARENLIDGVKRLRAVILANVPDDELPRMVVCRNVSQRARHVIDRNEMRNLADRLKVAKQVSVDVKFLARLMAKSSTVSLDERRDFGAFTAIHEFFWKYGGAPVSMGRLSVKNYLSYGAGYAQTRVAVGRLAAQCQNADDQDRLLDALSYLGGNKRVPKPVYTIAPLRDPGESRWCLNEIRKRFERSPLQSDKYLLARSYEAFLAELNQDNALPSRMTEAQVDRRYEEISDLCHQEFEKYKLNRMQFDMSGDQIAEIGEQDESLPPGGWRGKYAQGSVRINQGVSSGIEAQGQGSRGMAS